MKRYVIISSNNNPDYDFYVPIVKWSWHQLGWGVINLQPFELKPYSEVTITQCMRLYAAMLKELPNGQVIEKDDILMTSDADMIPLSDYWNPKYYDITCYGRDLTDYHYPMCYIAMSKRNWGKVMNINSKDIRELMRRDLELISPTPETEDTWFADQNLITHKINNHTEKPVLIDRGFDTETSLPLGRIDRSNNCEIPKGKLIDFHAPLNGWNHIEKIKEILKMAFGELPESIDKYTTDFIIKNKLS